MRNYLIILLAVLLLHQIGFCCVDQREVGIIKQNSKQLQFMHQGCWKIPFWGELTLFIPTRSSYLASSQLYIPPWVRHFQQNGCELASKLNLKSILFTLMQMT